MRVALLLILIGWGVTPAHLAGAQTVPTDLTAADRSSSESLALDVFTTVYLRGTSTMSVLVGVEVRGLRPIEQPANVSSRRLDVALDEINVTALSPSVSVTVPLEDATANKATRDGMSVFATVAMAVGRHSLRITVRDSADQKSGTVVHQVDVPNLTEGPVTMSGLSLSGSDVGAVMSVDRDEDRTMPLVGRPPTGRRRFSRRERVEVDAEIYTVQTVTLGDDCTEGQLRIATALLSLDGKVVFETSETGQSETLPSGAYGYQHYSLVPIASVPVGDYIVQVTATLDGLGSTSRSAPIAVID